MECQNTIKTLKFNKNKSIGTVVIIVEGESDEFKLLKHIFTKVLDYGYRSIGRNKIIHDEYYSEDNKNVIIVATTNNSNINSVIDDEAYKINLKKILSRDYNKNLNNIPIYIIWDRDKDIHQKNDKKKISHYQNSIKTFYSAYENDYEMNGLLLLSYPCHEAFIISNFVKRSYLKTYTTSLDCKKDFRSLNTDISNITEETILFAIENMHRSLLKMSINNYDPSDFKHINEQIFRIKEEQFHDCKYTCLLSLISVMFVDLGIIEEKNTNH